mgnify:CR=1 FL=1
MIEPSSRPLFSARHRRGILVSLLLSAAIYLAVVFYIGYDDVAAVFSRTSVLFWVILLACSFSNYVIRFIRWLWYVKVFGYRLPTHLHFLYYLAGFALTTTPGKAGETIRSLLLRPHGVTYPISLACFFTERFLDVVVIALLASLTVFAFPDYRLFVVVMTILVLLSIPLLRSSLFIRALHAMSRQITSPRLNRFIQHALTLIDSARRLLSWPKLFAGLGAGMLAWCIQGIAFYYLLLTLGLDISLAVAMGIYAISLLAGAVSFIPGGVGTTEVVMGLLISLLGAEPAVAVSAPLISRLTTLWFAVGLGLLSATALGISRRQP